MLAVVFCHLTHHTRWLVCRRVDGFKGGQQVGTHCVAHKPFFLCGKGVFYLAVAALTTKRCGNLPGYSFVPLRGSFVPLRGSFVPLRGSYMPL